MIKSADLGLSDYYVQQAKYDISDLGKKLDSEYELDLSHYLDVNQLFKPKAEPGYKWVDKKNKWVKVKIKPDKKTSKPARKPCKADQVRNPKTGRCMSG